MKNLLFMFFILLFFVSCGNMTQEETSEMENFEDSVKRDTAKINEAVNAANDFLNNDSIKVDSVAAKK